MSLSCDIWQKNADSVASERELRQPRPDQEMQEAVKLEEVLQGAHQHGEVRRTGRATAVVW